VIVLYSAGDNAQRHSCGRQRAANVSFPDVDITDQGQQT